jgi:hypothetical protein
VAITIANSDIAIKIDAEKSANQAKFMARLGSK